MILWRPDILSNGSQGRKIKNFTANAQGVDDFLLCGFENETLLPNRYRKDLCCNQRDSHIQKRF